MVPTLDTRFFIDKENDKHPLPINLLDMFGNNFKKWLLDILKAYGVSDQPIIKGQVHRNAHLEGPVFIDENASVEPFSYIKGPAYIGPYSQVRHSAYLRGYVYLSSKAVAGHSTEIKESCLLQGAKAAHFAYLGNSFLAQNTNNESN